MSLSPLGSGEIASQSGEDLEDLLVPPLIIKINHLEKVFGDDIAGLISDAFEKHTETLLLIEPAQLYADKLTEATIEKLTPLTTLVRDSVEGVGEAL